jgi:plastocyanin
MPLTLRRHSPLVLALVALGALVPSGAARAQGAVDGQLVLVERPGEHPRDLVNAGVMLEPVGGAPVSRAAATKGTMTLQGRQFVPRVRVVAQGSTIEFPNQDPFNHNVFSKAVEGAFDTGVFGRGKSRAQTFARGGVYPLYCDVHPRMTAFVVVTRTPWVAQPGADGRFTIADVPAGRYVLRAWHDRAAAEHTAELEVPAAGARGVKVELDARGYKYVQHANKHGKPYASAGDRY